MSSFKQTDPYLCSRHRPILSFQTLKLLRSQKALILPHSLQQSLYCPQPFKSQNAFIFSPDGDNARHKASHSYRHLHRHLQHPVKL
ncbi:hypothetical protein BC829DRAFT_69090 [Chytridium lagenaria]|nr:hypothetical protein BC829DRAFT_69090 [Chytridium lagenaria]